MAEQTESTDRTTVRLLRSRGGERTSIQLSPRQLGLVNQMAQCIDPEGSPNARFSLTTGGLVLQFDGDVALLEYAGSSICAAVLAAETVVIDVRDLPFWNGDKLCGELSDGGIVEIGVMS